MEPQGFYRIEEDEGNPAVAGLSHLSYSRINRYLTCPWQYKLYYVEGLRPELPAASLFFGKAIHKALAAFFQENDNAITVFQDEWERLKDKPLRYAHRESWESLHERGSGLLAKFLMEELRKLSCVEASEKPFELAISNLDVPFVGVIDLMARLEGVQTVIDFKTASTSYQEHEVRLSDQLSAYQLAQPQAPQLALCVLVKTKEPRIEWYTARRESQQLQEFLAKAEIVGRHVEENLFYKRPGKWCAWCEYLPICQA